MHISYIQRIKKRCISSFIKYGILYSISSFILSHFSLDGKSSFVVKALLSCALRILIYDYIIWQVNRISLSIHMSWTFSPIMHFYCLCTLLYAFEIPKAQISHYRGMAPFPLILNE